MARAKETKEVTAVISAEEINTAPLAASIAVPVVAPAATPWREGMWSGMPVYYCHRCPYATLDEERIRSHRCELPTTGA